MLSMPRIVRPDPNRFTRTEFGFPVESATRQSIKRNKELEKSLRSWGAVNGNRELLLDVVEKARESLEACAPQTARLTFPLGNGVCLSSAEEELHLS